MATVEQIKAARALLKWNQQDLADASGISKPAIANMERGRVQPREDTMRAITQSIEHAGVEFTEGPGVRLVGERIQVTMFEGQEAIFRLMDDIESTLDRGLILRANGIDERRFMAIDEVRVTKYLERWQHKGIESRLLIKQGDTMLLDAPEHYRYVSAAQFSTVPYFVYRDKCGMMLWEPIVRVLLIENATLAASYRQQFNHAWEGAKRIEEAP